MAPIVMTIFIHPRVVWRRTRNFVIAALGHKLFYQSLFSSDLLLKRYNLVVNDVHLDRSTTGWANEPCFCTSDVRVGCNCFWWCWYLSWLQSSDSPNCLCRVYGLSPIQSAIDKIVSPNEQVRYNCSPVLDSILVTFTTTSSLVIQHLKRITSNDTHACFAIAW